MLKARLPRLQIFDGVGQNQLIGGVLESLEHHHRSMRRFMVSGLLVVASFDQGTVDVTADFPDERRNRFVGKWCA